jgi:hypothetical protein
MPEAATTLASSPAEAARRRGVTRLAHFTPLNNLLGIVELGAIVARDRLLALARERNDTFLLDYIAFNDRLRLDRCTNHVNLSVQHPNARLLSRFRALCVCDVWCVLLVSPACLETPGVLFAVGNAAARRVRQGGIAGGVAGFEALFRDGQLSANQFQASRLTRRGLDDNLPTDPQAEVLFPGEIPLRLVDGIAFEDPLSLARAQAAIRLAGDGGEPVTPLLLFVDPHLFHERTARNP